MLKLPRFAAAILALVSISVSAQLTNQAKPLVTQPVNDSRRVELHGSVHPLVRVASDQGPLADDLALNRILMTLRRSDEQETALKQLVDEQQDKNSPNFHKWLTPEEFGARFGASDTDIATLTSWLTAHGFNNVSVNKGRTTVEFSGSAGAMRQAFGVSMHQFSYLGKSRTANITDPLIPAALAPLVSGFSSLNNFPRKTFAEKYGIYRRDSQTGKLQQVGGTPQYVLSSNGANYLGVTPHDFATLYNLNPLWNASVNGAGQTIAIVGESDLNPQDFVNFRNLFGLPLGNTSGPTGTQYLNIIYNGPNPGTQDDEIEGNIDVQWSGAAAPNATIDYVSSMGTETTAGIDLSAQYIIDNNLAPIISESWGVCEFAAGTSGNSFYRALWQQAAAQGITVLVAAGDAGSGTCDQNKSYASYGLTVNAIASTPYNTAIGGTDFQTLYGDNGKFGSSNNSTTKASVSAYIPETTWNNTCTNEQLSQSTTYLGFSPEAVCNNSTAQSKGLLTTTGGGGGRSNCIAPSGNTLSTCSSGGGYPKPAWQKGTGVPADSVRDLPDVSLFASNGFSRAFYIVCQADQLTDGKGCNISSPYNDLIGVGGTSVGSPAMAGIMALVAQKNGGGRLGNANYNLYALFNKQTTAGMACSASGTPNAACTFNDIIAGTNSVPCVKGSPNCTVNNSADSYGILSGFSSTVGYDLTTGLGSVNATNLANNWSTVTYNSTSTTLSLSPTSITHGTSVTASVSVSSGSGTPTGDVTINGATTNGSVGSGTLNGGSYSGTFNNFPGGTYSVKAHYGGDATHAASDSNAVTMTVTPENSKTTAQTLFYNPSNGTVGTASSIFYGQYLALIKFTVAGANCPSTPPCGIPTGTITVRNNGATYVPSSYTLNSDGVAEIQTTTLVPAAYSFNGTYSGDASFTASTSGTSAFTVTKAPTSTTVSASSTGLIPGQSTTLTINVPTQSYGDFQTGTVSILNGSSVLATVAVKGTYSTTTGQNYATATYTLNGSQLSTGANSITAQYNGDGNYSSSTSTATTITLAPFSLSASPTSVTVSAGSSATSTISVAAASGFTSSVALSCSISGSPTGVGCTLSPSSVNPGTTSTLTITTVHSSARTGVFSEWRPAVFSGVTVAGLLLLTVPRRRRFASLLGVALLLAIAGVAGGCGGGSSSSKPGTPTGTYTVTVSGTSGSTTQTASVALTVN
ncbi:Ig-like domain repeat protein [Terriglobus albidus]|nr:Ig-like domain repeat protein [Terriglobus albidus]